MGNRDTIVTVRMNKALKNRLDVIAFDLGLSRAAVIRMGLAELVLKYEKEDDAEKNRKEFAERVLKRMIYDSHNDGCP